MHSAITLYHKGTNTSKEHKKTQLFRLFQIKYEQPALQQTTKQTFNINVKSLTAKHFSLNVCHICQNGVPKKKIRPHEIYWHYSLTNPELCTVKDIWPSKICGWYLQSDQRGQLHPEFIIFRQNLVTKEHNGIIWNTESHCPSHQVPLHVVNTGLYCKEASVPYKDIISVNLHPTVLLMKLWLHGITKN